jgi:hypothetical protein
VDSGRLSWVGIVLNANVFAFCMITYES